MPSPDLLGTSAFDPLGSLPRRYLQTAVATSGPDQVTRVRDGSRSCWTRPFSMLPANEEQRSALKLVPDAPPKPTAQNMLPLHFL
jgi:hypothetical protein